MANGSGKITQLARVFFSAYLAAMQTGMHLTENHIENFRNIVWEFYRQHARPMPFREDTSPYAVFVSEVMLQQTQVDRVIPKFLSFTARFPSFSALASAPLADVVAEWSGLGYNRRAKFLRDAAEIIVTRHGEILPAEPSVLVALPGIGHATSCSIAAFAFNSPVVFVETNIRRVAIHHFFHDVNEVSDTDVLAVAAAILDRENPRHWYYAMMDYGTHLKQTIPNPNRRSAHYSVQSKFEGSLRQVRGAVLKQLTVAGSATAAELAAATGFPPERVEKALEKLTTEQILCCCGDKYRFSS